MERWTKINATDLLQLVSDPTAQQSIIHKKYPIFTTLMMTIMTGFLPLKISLSFIKMQQEIVPQPYGQIWEALVLKVILGLITSLKKKLK